MSLGAFTDRHTCPGPAEIEAALGPALPLWEGLLAYVRGVYPAREELKFLYGKQYGWALRFQVKSQLLINLYPNRGFFTAQVNLSPRAVVLALALDLGEPARAAITKAVPYSEGRWVYIPVASESGVRDVQRLLALRAADKRLV